MFRYRIVSQIETILWLTPKPTSIPSGILIHPAVWPQ